MLFISKKETYYEGMKPGQYQWAKILLQVFHFMPLFILFIWIWFNLPTPKWNCSPFILVECLCLSGAGGSTQPQALTVLFIPVGLGDRIAYCGRAKMVERDNLHLSPSMLEHIYTKVWLMLTDSNPNLSKKKSVHNKGQKKNTHKLETETCAYQERNSKESNSCDGKKYLRHFQPWC